MADDDKLDSHKHRRKKAGTPEWSETCIGFWSKTYKEIPGKENEEQRRCRGISILHLNKVYCMNVLRVNSVKVKNKDIIKNKELGVGLRIHYFIPSLPVLTRPKVFQPLELRL